jgi:hypothetical protein
MPALGIHNVQIKHRIYFAMCLILALVVGLAWEAVTQTDALWAQTRTMYDHPLKVRRALGALEAEVTAIHRDMRGLMLAGSQMEIEALLAQIEACQANAFRQLDALEDRYLGPPEDVTAIRAEFVRWKTIRDETIRLVLAGKVKVAAARTKPNAIGGVQAQKLYEKTSVVDKFSRSKGDQLFQQATSLNASLHRRLVLYACASLFLVLVIAYFLVAWVRNPGCAGPMQERTAASNGRSRHISARPATPASAQGTTGLPMAVSAKPATIGPPPCTHPDAIRAAPAMPAMTAAGHAAEPHRAASTSAIASTTAATPIKGALSRTIIKQLRSVTVQRAGRPSQGHREGHPVRPSSAYDKRRTGQNGH